MTRRKRKLVTMQVTVSCPTWLPAAQARREVRALINDQCHWGHLYYHDGETDDIGEHNFRVRKIKGIR